MPQTQSQLVAASVAASGTATLAASASAAYTHFKFLCSVTGGTATFVAKHWVDSARKVDASASLAAVSQGSISIDAGPYENLEISWSSNTGTVNVDVEWDHPYGFGGRAS